MKTEQQTFLQWFRAAAPYIHAHRGKTFVIQFNGDLVLSGLFQEFIHDVALLNSLGIRLVLVFGVRPQVERLLKERGIQSIYREDLRVTDQQALQCFKEAVGSVRVELEALFSMGMPDSAMARSRIRISSGNFVTAKPMGIIDGVDMQYTGSLRRIDSDAIKAKLDDGDIVLLSSLGYSVTGEVFNLSSLEVATYTAIGLRADKLIFNFPHDGIKDQEGHRLHQMTQAEAVDLLNNIGHKNNPPYIQLSYAVQACHHAVGRVHLIDSRDDGSLMIELFSRDGIGTLVSASAFDVIRKATLDDISGILDLIKPLEQEGKLVSRTRENMELDLDDYIVSMRDDTVIACAALHIYEPEQVVEIACLVVHPDYRGLGKGEELFNHLQNNIKKQGLKQVFVLTTHAEHWFLQQGFVESTIDVLPVKKQELYNYQRNSKVLVKQL